ncbi:GNAT family N-acetyltransferase/peptidase C39 family protein [Alteromonas gilva]|uniref:GNAT family N-acetyltransferase/peptidase C39 family protein n=1 Tax=Alteromonas gilva TaxID=2987522 RepID=A0ABT5L4J3_9ALTE|nr:GNAT family N-acetyltransferase/peptidase C39 family protein [Alteromonas gilva]MDC8831778.1 GNAT family N-acetyltransferase/peptidase C39 family protein [Alteromonas gilva]
MNTDDTGLTLRSATVADLDALVTLENSCFANDKLSRRSLRHYVQASSAELVVIEQQGNLLAYGLLLFRRGTLLTRLYSLAVAEIARGQGLAEKVIGELELRASQRGKRYMRLEVAEHNHGAIRLYRRLGFLPFAVTAHYYEDDATAIRMQKALPLNTAGKSLRECPWYQQSTAFTCGPASLMMAMAMVEPDLPMNQSEELAIWRTANTVYMTSGPAGTHPLGLAMAAIERGFEAKVYLSHEGPLFIDGVRNEHKRQTLIAVENDFFQQAEAQQLPVFYTDWFAALDQEANASDRALLCLISTYRLDRSKAPHWVVVTGTDEHCVYIHDPDPDTDAAGSGMLDYQHIPVARDDFQRMASYGKRRVQAAVVIRRPQPDLMYSDFDLAV